MNICCKLFTTTRTTAFSIHEAELVRSHLECEQSCANWNILNAKKHDMITITCYIELARAKNFAITVHYDELNQTKCRF